MNYGIIKTIFVLVLFTGVETGLSYLILKEDNLEKDEDSWYRHYAFINTLIVYIGLLYLCMKYF